MREPTPPQTTGDTLPAASEPPTKPFRPPLRNGCTWLLIVGFLGVLLWLQWPMLKGSFYRAAQSEPPASAVHWRHDFDSALADARASEKPVLLVFGATWCPPCVAMKHEVWPEQSVGSLANQKFIPMYVDVDDAEHAELVAAYGITGIPAVLILDGEGRVREQAAYMSRAETLRFLKSNAG